jgi:aminoglycoside phosphotransferase (APT) family kinase protein
MVRNGDTAAIRPGEELDVESLYRYLRTHLPEAMRSSCSVPESAQIEVEQFPGGHSNLTYLIRLRGQEFVLRRPPLGPVAPRAHDMPREYRLLVALHRVFPLAPKPYLLCEDETVIGAPFYLMERRRGIIIRQEEPKQLGGDKQLRRRISEAMVDTLAQLHSIDIYSSGLERIGKPVGFVRRQVLGWSERWQRAKTSELAEIEQVIGWLESHIPVEADMGCASLVHNDFKLDNVMLDQSEPWRVVAVLDWEMCTVGDPLVDLGILLCYWPQRDDPPGRRGAISGVTTEAGWMSRAEIAERYAQKTGRDLSRISFYEVFALFKVAVVLQQIYFRYVRGQTRDQRFKDFDQRVKGLVQAAYDLIERS